MRTVAIIPARYAASRFPGKPLVDIGGKSMIRRVCEQAGRAELIDEVIVATDDDRIYRHVLDFGGQARMTRTDHRSGTDRCAEVAKKLSGVGFVVNVQGDEPFIDPRQIDQIARPLREGQAAITTLARRIEEERELFSPHAVKVVFTASRQALYFSRSAIPFQRDVSRPEWTQRPLYYKHIGLYGFSLDALLAVTALPLSPYEEAEALEQLRWLEAGWPIHLELTERETRGIDTPEDLQRLQEEGSWPGQENDS